MSKAAVGRNRIQMGTTEYLVNLNQGAELTVYLSGLNVYNYSQALQNRARRIQVVIASIHSDLETHAGILRYVSSTQRSQLANLVERLEAVCSLASSDSGKARECRSLLAQTGMFGLSRSLATTSDLERGAALMHQGGESGLHKITRLATVKEAVTYGESFAIGSDEGKRIFLAELTKGQFNGFLPDLWDYYNYRENPGEYCGSNGHQICSDAYLSAMERQGFPGATSSVRMQADYASLILSGLRSVFRAIDQDVFRAQADHDSMTAEHGQRLVQAVGELEACGLGSSGSLQSRIEKLCWYAEVDPLKVQQLQQALNQMGLGFNLEEDGVYGLETSNAWSAFLDCILSGAIPTITALNQGVTAADVSLQSVGIGHALYQNMQSQNPLLGPLPRNSILSIRMPIPNGYMMLPVQRINTDARYVQIPESAYQFLQKFRSTGKIVKIGGRVVLAGGIVLDTLELGASIIADLNDADRKLGKTTLRAAFSIGGKWAGTIAGAKIGAAVGTWAAGLPFLSIPGGAVALPLMGVLFLGYHGSNAGESLGGWIVDITLVGE